jgi:hypothetical protein
MSTRKTLVAVLVALLACVLQGALCAGVAGADVPGLVGNGYFESEGDSGVAVDNSCYLHQPRLEGGACESFDPSNGDVYAMGFVTDGLRSGLSQKFDASGKVLSLPSPFPTETLNYGAAVNPTNGHLYVASPFGAIDIYASSTGELLSSFSVPRLFTGSTYEALFAEDAQIATNAAGDVYVPVRSENKVLEYSEEGILVETFAGSGAHALNLPTGVAVDSSGDVWVANEGDSRIEELSPTGAFMGEFASEGVRVLALDAHGDVLAILDNSADVCEPVQAPCEHLVEYSSSGAQLADVGAGYFGTIVNLDIKEAGESMVAVDDASGRVYVTDGLKNRVWMFQPPVAPVLGQESAVEVGTYEAKLGTVVSPGGARTSYRFEYLSEAAFQTDKESFSGPEEPVSVPFPEGSAGEGFSARTVWASAKGLAEGTTYHYRVVVTNGVGTAVGPDQTFTTETAAQAACPNEQFRGGFSAALPDCRAYELVSPVNKDTAEPDTPTNPKESPYAGISENYAADDGNRFAFVSFEVMPGSQTSAGLTFLATRGASGWSTEDALPLESYTGDRCDIPKGANDRPKYSTSDAVVRYSADLSKAVIVVNEAVIGNECLAEAVEVAPGEPVDEENLLLRDDEDGTYQLINLTPPGVTPTRPTFVAASADLNAIVFSERAKLTPEALNDAVNLYEWREGVVRLLQFQSPSGTPLAGTVVSISPDGSDVFFSANGNLYVRLNGGERTVQLDEPRGGSGPGGGGSSAAVSADGSQVFFTDNATAGLTKDTVPGSGTNLYSYDVSTGQLSDLTPVSNAEAALTGVSEDGSYVYFTSKGVLSGSEANQFGETAQDGQENLYLEHDGTVTFLMHGAEGHTISANGAFLLANGYLYSAAADRLVPTGVNLSSNSHFFLSNSGQVFFGTSEALLPAATNGLNDVYEFDYESGLHLISTGTSSSPDELLGASQSGNDVFFLTRQQLVPKDSFEESIKVYDARVDGGFPEPAPAPACTTADACRAASAPQPAIYGAPSSQTFAGAGNLAPPPAVLKRAVKSKQCRQGFVKKRGKCIKKEKAKKARKAKKSTRAINDRRGS